MLTNNAVTDVEIIPRGKSWPVVVAACSFAIKASRKKD